jgi:hypothetical protein
MDRWLPNDMADHDRLESPYRSGHRGRGFDVALHTGRAISTLVGQQTIHCRGSSAGTLVRLAELAGPLCVSEEGL